MKSKGDDGWEGEGVANEANERKKK